MKTRKVRRLKGVLLNVAKTMGRWHPQDDYLLIQSIMQLMNLDDVHKLTKFSRKFTRKEIEDRWYAVLYDVPISKMIYKNLKKLHYDDIIRLKRKAPFSQTETMILMNVESNLEESKQAEFFETLLSENRTSFHEGRTPAALAKYWNRLKKLNLLKDQEKELESEMSRSTDDYQAETKHYLKRSFKEIENELDDNVINENVELDENLEKSMSECYNDLLGQIRRREAELFLWQILIDKITGNANPFMDMSTFAVMFFGEKMYSMNKPEIILGRSSKAKDDNKSLEVDVDLSEYYLNQTELSQPMNTKKISRNQCKIAMLDPTKFFIYNRGKMPIFVDGKILMSQTKTQLYDKSFIEIGDIKILFFININLVAQSITKSLTE